MDHKSFEQRKTILKILQASRRGHVGSAFSILEITRVLYDTILKFDAINPAWEDRDRFILSKGHGCLALYVQLAEKGFFSKDLLWDFCKSESILGGHPERGKTPGVEASTGSLGHGLAIGIGMALAAKMDNRGHRIVVLLGDGECNEGSVWESVLSAAHHKLDNLTVLVDQNDMQCYSGTQDVLNLEPFADKWNSFGFEVHRVNGHDVNALEKVLKQTAVRNHKPHAILCQTKKGAGVPGVENNASWHHKAKLTDEELQTMMDYFESCAKPA